jgi:hypothetical protein
VTVNKKDKYGCTDYREEMMLAGLRVRLQKEDLSEEEKNAILKEIRSLERAAGLD